MSAAPSAIPPNPNIAAMIAITKNITDQRNILIVFNVTFVYACSLTGLHAFKQIFMPTAEVLIYKDQCRSITAFDPGRSQF